MEPGCKIPSRPQTRLKHSGNNEAAVSCEGLPARKTPAMTAFSPAKVSGSPKPAERKGENKSSAKQESPAEQTETRHPPHVRQDERHAVNHNLSVQIKTKQKKKNPTDKRAFIQKTKAQIQDWFFDMPAYRHASSSRSPCSTKPLTWRMTTRGDNRADELTASSPWLRSWDPSLIFEGGKAVGGSYHWD